MAEPDAALIGAESGFAPGAFESTLTLLRRHAWVITRLSTFAIVTVVLAFGDPRKFSHSIPGNPGDAYLILATLEWGGQRAFNLFRGYWDGPIFAGGDAAMAYTDTLLPIAVPFGVLERLTGSRVVAFNLLYLASWVVCAEATYRLGLRLLASRGAALFAAVAFTFSTIRLEQAAHFQLAWAGFVPLSVLLLLRFRGRPTVPRGLALATSVIVQMLTSAYHGVIVIVFTAAVVAGGFATAVFRRRWRDALAGTAAFFAALVVVMLPVQHMYSVAEHSAQPRSGYPAYGELHLGDLRTPSPSADLPRVVGFFDRGPDGRSENYAYVGALVMVLAPIATAVVAVRRGRVGLNRGQLAEWGLLLGLGALGFVLAIGRRPILGFELPFYDLGRTVVPGLDSMVAIVRLVVFTQLALVLVAAWALTWLLRQRRPLIRALVPIAAVAFVVAEAHQDHSFVRVVSPESNSVYAVMQDLDPGVAVELPIAGRETGAAYAFIESTRAVLGTDDDVQLFNGYSGHTPNDYDAAIPVLNSFPSAESIELIERLGIDYVVLHTAPIRTGMPALDPSLDGTGYTYFEPTEAARRVSAAPAEGFTPIQAQDGIVIEVGRVTRSAD